VAAALVAFALCGIGTAEQAPAPAGLAGVGPTPPGGLAPPPGALGMQPTSSADGGAGARPGGGAIEAPTTPGARAGAAAGAGAGAERRLPANATTRHALELPDGRTLRFTATAGSLSLPGPQGAAQAELAYIAYRLNGAEPRSSRPVTFALNGGPGASSAWLQLGALGPWRLPIAGAAAVPSAAPELVPNAETWLGFTDLVFLDPVGTGYSGFLTGEEEVRRRLWSVEGDVRSLAAAVRRWLEEHGRVASPKFLVGESYGGFRVPRLARALQSEEGVGPSGLVLVSPALDLGGRSEAFDPLLWVGRLPTMAAAARAAAGEEVTRAALAEVERYAAGDYLLDLVRGERDTEASARLGERVAAALPGVDPGVARRRHGQVEPEEFLRELWRGRGPGPGRGAAGLVASAYDASVAGADPFPLAARGGRHPDPLLDALLAPLAGAIRELYAGRLGWRPGDGRRYEVLNRDVARAWDWGPAGRASRPEALGALRTALALDPRLRVLVAHGLFDLVTPYFATALLLDQIPERAGAERVRFAALPGGHMCSTRSTRPARRCATGRAPQLPDVPTFAELGHRDMSFFAWFGLFAPAATPRPVVEQLNRAVAAAADPGATRSWSNGPGRPSRPARRRRSPP
jgi:carboxypeptidase C (cathepsin A)